MCLKMRKRRFFLMVFFCIETVVKAAIEEIVERQEDQIKMKNKTETIIKYNNRGYKVRILNVDDLGFVNICSNILNRLLVDGDSNYVSDEARYIDEQIFYFIAPSSFKLSDKDLVHKILEEMY